MLSAAHFAALLTAVESAVQCVADVRDHMAAEEEEADGLEVHPDLAAVLRPSPRELPPLSPADKRALRSRFPRVSGFPSEPLNVSKAVRNLLPHKALTNALCRLHGTAVVPLWRNVQSLAGLHAQLAADDVDLDVDAVRDQVLAAARLQMEVVRAVDAHVRDTLLRDAYGTDVPAAAITVARKGPAIAWADIDSLAAFSEDAAEVSRLLRPGTKGAAKGAASSSGKPAAAGSRRRRLRRDRPHRHAAAGAGKGGSSSSR